MKNQRIETSKYEKIRFVPNSVLCVNFVISMAWWKLIFQSLHRTCLCSWSLHRCRFKVHRSASPKGCVKVGACALKQISDERSGSVDDRVTDTDMSISHTCWLAYRHFLRPSEREREGQTDRESGTRVASPCQLGGKMMELSALQYRFGGLQPHGLLGSHPLPCIH